MVVETWKWTTLGSTVAAALVAYKVFGQKFKRAHSNDPFAQDSRRPASVRENDEAVRNRVLRTGITDQVGEQWDAIVIGLTLMFDSHHSHLLSPLMIHHNNTQSDVT